MNSSDIHSFRYVAINRAGFRINGDMATCSLKQANAILLSHNLQPLSIRQSNVKGRFGFGFGSGLGFGLGFGKGLVSRHNSQAPISLLSQLTERLESGMPLYAALADLQLSSDVMVAGMAADLLFAVTSGMSLSAALRELGYLGELPIRMIAVAEQAGNLVQGLQDAGELLLSRQRLIKRIRKATAYPVFMLLVLFLLFIYLLVFVVPALSGFLQGLGQELPVSVLWVMSISAAASQGMFLWYALGASLLAVAAMVVLYRISDSWKLRVDSLLLKTPLYGDFLLLHHRSRFNGELSMLLAGGIGLLDAIDSIAWSTSNSYLRLNTQLIRTEVVEGLPLVAAMRCSGLFSTSILQLIDQGESTGDYADVLARAHHRESTRLREALDRLERQAGPAMMIVAGLMILWIIVTIIGPMYGAAINSGSLL